MVVITLEKCPLSLRGDLTKWLLEISLGVYVGTISARVRENLWQRVCEECKSGRATMVYSARNEQHLNFKVHNTSWKPMDFDGLKLMMHPNASHEMGETDGSSGFSIASQQHKAASIRKKRLSKGPNEYVVLDLETTGLDPQHDRIIEVAAIRVVLGEVVDEFQSIIKEDMSLSSDIIRLTGISQSDLSHGRNAVDVAEELCQFIENYPLVMHNATFDLAFIDELFYKYDIDEVENSVIDTLLLARKKYPKMSSHSLKSLSQYFNIETDNYHRALSDCYTTNEVFCNLINESSIL